MAYSAQSTEFERWLAERLEQAVARREIPPTLLREFWADAARPSLGCSAAVRLIRDLARVSQSQAEALLHDLESKNPLHARTVLQNIAEGWIRQHRSVSGAGELRAA